MVENIEWYRAFYYAAKTGSLTGAAAELFVTQPAVTHAVRQLENRLGGPLFVRTSKGVRLTPEGAELYGHIEAAFRLIRSGERKIAEMRDLLAGEIRIGAGDTLCRHYLLPHMKAFHERYPNVKFRVTNRTSLETMELLGKGEIDLGIVNLPLADKRADIVEAVTLQDCLAAGAAYRHLAETGLTPAGLTGGLLLILLERGSSTRAAFDAFAAAHGVDARPEIELGSIDLLVEFARSGFGIACVVRDFIGEELARGELFEVKLEPPLPPRSVGIATLRGAPLPAAAERFIRRLLAPAGQDGGDD
ncbi:LysR family transcriptional regulator [Paenibacillus humicola]|uniref:LysR family transcriptional regulator n=1 Tax=Paenibacillus humicola TaxID=3110540 RepID=UPI00237BD6BA|nr:LysR family transcriptional regulator [Paenibacillus humicola]